MTASLEEWELRIGKLHLESGDILAIRTDQDMQSIGDPRRFMELMKDLVPEGVKLVVFAGDIELDVIHFSGDVVADEIQGGAK